MKRISILLLAATSLAVPACSNDVASSGNGGDGSGDGDNNNGSSGGSNAGSGGGSASQDKWDQVLASRTTDYSAALKIAALRLTGDLPKLTEIQQVASASGEAQRQAYEQLVTDYMSRPTFATQMFLFWRDTFKVGGAGTNFDATLDTAPAFATALAINNGSYMDLFTKATGNCATFNAGNGTVADAECTNGGPKAGVLTNPGVMKQFYSNFAFRRVRWVQETFDCLRFPAEVSTTGGTNVGGAAPYLGVWPFDSIASTKNGGRVDFQDTSSVICANCHSDMNHIAPLFAYYDTNGAYKTTVSVPTPLTGAPMAQLSDFLPAGQTTAWRYQVPTADLPALGTAMAADPAIAKCGVARVWNFAFGKEDIVDQLVDVPSTTIQKQLDAFTQNGFKLKDMIFSVFTSDAFVKF